MCGLNTASTYMSAGIYENALIVGVEILKKIIDWKDGKVAVLLEMKLVLQLWSMFPKNYFR